MSVSLYGSGQTVIQVVQGSLTTTFSTTSTSFVSTGLFATITPQSTTSKILIMVSGDGYITSPPASLFTTIYRGATNLASGTNNTFQQLYSSSTASIAAPITMSFIDSPATTSATTYTLYAASPQSVTATIGLNNAPCYIQLLEISGS